jgi:hypothetical protein
MINGWAKRYTNNEFVLLSQSLCNLRNKGIEPEIIDLLQGRTSSSVFVNHYYRPVLTR